MRNRATFFICLVIISNTACAQEEKDIGFSADFLACIEKESKAVSEQEEIQATVQEKVIATQQKIKSMPVITADRVDQAINVSAGMYALAKIVVLYRNIYLADNNQTDASFFTTMQHYIGSLYPASLHNNGKFVLGSAGIILETLLYKTLAQFVVLCWRGNIFDALERGANRAKSFIGL